METDSFVIYRSVFDEMLAAFDCTDREQGGVLGAGRDGVICSYYHDIMGICTPNGYRPDIQSINRVLSENWRPKGVYLSGLIHSHTNGNRALSCGDIAYGVRILREINVTDRLWLPVIYRATYGEWSIMCYSLDREGVCRSHSLWIVE